MSKPNTYGPDYAASIAGARLQWDALRPDEQEALLMAMVHGGPCSYALYSKVCTKKVRDRVQARGLAWLSAGTDPKRWHWLSPMGLLVREAGLAARAEGQR